MINCNVVAIPADPHTVLKKIVDKTSNQPDIDTFHRQVIGSLVYITMGLHPDMAYIVNKLSQFLETSSTVIHLDVAKCMLNYLSETVDISIKFCTVRGNQNKLVVFCDANYTACMNICKSISGVMLMLNRGPIVCISHKQTVLVTSTTDTEYTVIHAPPKRLLGSRNSRGFRF
ncbi:uncharacterized protein [Centruroides vittatus]|uniref:uncharacterized protein n=1 Tax=Centruroides vittatus TaxID=120091 RepID=UPI00350FC776